MLTVQRRNAASVDPLAEFRNSEGLTPAESWRRTASSAELNARVARAQAEKYEQTAASYREMADKWEAEILGN